MKIKYHDGLLCWKDSFFGDLSLRLQDSFRFINGNTHKYVKGNTVVTAVS